MGCGKGIFVACRYVKVQPKKNNRDEDDRVGEARARALGDVKGGGNDEVFQNACLDVTLQHHMTLPNG